jgi:isopenicillin-N N-acyltransferase-like protein
MDGLFLHAENFAQPKDYIFDAVYGCMTELLKTKGYSVLEVSGGAHERGFAYGVHHKSLIRRLIDSHYEYYASHFKASKQEALRYASVYVGAVKGYSEVVADELGGIAEGSGASLNEIMLIAAFNEVFYPRLSKACTAFSVRGKATADGLTYVGQNNDEGIEPWLDGECTTLTRYKQKDAPDALIYTYAGAPAMMGINSKGLAVCINALGFDRPRTGVPMLCVVREVLNQSTLSDAVNAIERADRAFSLNFMIGASEGIVNVEANPLKLQLLKSEDVLFHANHYLCGTNGFDQAKTEAYLANSKARCDRMAQLLNQSKGSLDLLKLQGFLRDHENRPNTICVHPSPAKPKWRRSRTLDGMIYISEKREAWISRGNPCQNEFVRYTV